MLISESPEVGTLLPALLFSNENIWYHSLICSFIARGIPITLSWQITRTCHNIIKIGGSPTFGTPANLQHSSIQVNKIPRTAEAENAALHKETWRELQS